MEIYICAHLMRVWERELMIRLAELFGIAIIGACHSVCVRKV